jgi:hypothetical protein
LEDFEKKFPAIQGERKKNHAAYNREKKYHANKSAQKKIPTCKSTDVLHFSVVSTGLQDFAFLSRHICLKEHGVNSGQHHKDSTTFGAYNIQIASGVPCKNCCPPLSKSGLKICTSL